MPKPITIVGVLYLHHKEWIKAKQDFTLARKGGVDIVQAFDKELLDSLRDTIAPTPGEVSSDLSQELIDTLKGYADD